MMGGLYRHHRVTQAGGHVVQCSYSASFLLVVEWRGKSLRTVVRPVLHPAADELAQVMRFCVKLLPKRSSPNPQI